MSHWLHKHTGALIKVRDPWRTLLVLSVLGMICVTVYGNTLNAPFMFDDVTNITKNPRIYIQALTLDSLSDFLKDDTLNRPLAYFTFALDYYVHRFDVTGYHIVNWLIHLASGLLVYFLTRQTLRLMNKNIPGAPFLAAALWMTNPVHTQSVTYIVQRMNALSAMFYLASLVFYIRARTGQLMGKRPKKKSFILFFLSAGAGICSLASKQIAVTLPLVLFLYEWFFIQDLRKTFVKKQTAWILTIVAGITLLALIFLKGNPVSAIMSDYDKQPFTMGERLLTQPRVIAQYLSLLLLPLPERLSLEHWVPVSRTLTSPATTLPALGLLMLITLTAVLRAKKNRLFAFTVFWFLITLAVESSFIGLALMFEHRTYLPSVFLFITITCGLRQHVRPGWLATATMIVLIAVSGFWTRQRNDVWADEVRFWQDNIKKSPKSIRPYNNLGVALAVNGRYEEGIAACLQSIALSSPATNTANAYNNISRMYQKQGDSTRAIAYGRRAIEIDPGLGEAHLNLGKALLAENDLDEAVTHLEKAIELAPLLTPAYTILAQAYYSKDGNVDNAINICRQALLTDPENAAAEVFMAGLLQQSGKPQQSLAHLQRVLDKHPVNPQANLYAGIAFNMMGKPDRAIAHLLRAAKAIPDNARIENELASALTAVNQQAMVLAGQGQFKKAAGILETLEALMPGSPTVSYNLACLYALQNQVDQSVRHLKKALKKGYDDWETLRTDSDLETIRGTAIYQELVSPQER